MNTQSKSFATRHPWLLGGTLGLGLFLFVLASSTWFPRIWDVRNQWLMQFTFFGLCFLALLVARYWKLRRRLKLWSVVTILIALNAIFGTVFAGRLRQFSMWNIDFVLAFEWIVAALFLDWFMDDHKRNVAKRLPDSESEKR